MLLVALLLALIAASAGEESPKAQNNSRIGRDSYLDAYTESHGGNSDLNQANPDREMNFAQGFPGGFQDEQFGGQYPYPAPSHQQHHYGPPVPPAYGPSRPMYGPPNYGPPPVPNYGIPYGVLGILDKLKVKLDLITIFKIVLKVVLFKKLISFIAIIFLLLFIPWLKAKKHAHHHLGGGGGGGGGGDEHDEEDDLLMRRNDRSLRDHNRLDNMAIYVMQAIENYTKDDSLTSNDLCDTLYCRVNKIAKKLSNRVSSKG